MEVPYSISTTDGTSKNTTKKNNHHGILKKESNRKKRRSIVWDEDNLHLNEIQKTPKMKIDEPKTPYHHDSFDDSIEYDGDADMSEDYGSFSHNFTRAPPNTEKSHSLMENWDELHDAMQKVKEKQDLTQQEKIVENKKLASSDKKVNLESDEERDKSSGSESESKHKFKYFKKR